MPAGTYALTLAGADEDSGASGDLDIRADVTIRGAGARSTRIVALAIDRALHVHGVRATLSGLTITGGRAARGAGVFSEGGRLTLSRCTLLDNVAQGVTGVANGNGQGGGVFQDLGSLVVSRCQFLRNSAFGQALDGDGDGVPGGDRDGDVDRQDRALFRGTFKKRAGQAGFLAFFDFDGDGDVDKRDQKQFNKRRGTVLRA